MVLQKYLHQLENWNWTDSGHPLPSHETLIMSLAVPHGTSSVILYFFS